MGKIEYSQIYKKNQEDWKAVTSEKSGGKYDTLVAGHYSENNHFIYELIQNAEDAGATKIIFDYYNDGLIIYHNGKPFDEADVIGICSFLDGTKDKDSVQTIGHFGLGFKSVYKYTDTPEVYSNHEAFRIVRYLLPEEQPIGDFPNDCSFVWDGKKKKVFSENENATKFILPYKKTIMSGNATVQRTDIMEKLMGLETEVLLFLKNIQQIIWVDNTKNRHGYYQKSISEDTHISTCRACDSARIDEKDKGITEAHYITFSRTIDLDQLNNSEVKIAFRLNATKNNIVPLTDSMIWVFFPTRDNSELPFIIHGTYETPVSREKIMCPSKFNDILLRKTEYLLVDCLGSLKERGLVTQNFIKLVLLPSFDKNRFPELREKIKKAFLSKELIPTKGGQNRAAEMVCIAVPYDLHRIVNREMLTGYFGTETDYVDFADVKNSTAYFRWLTSEIGVKVFGFNDFASLSNQHTPDDFVKYEDLLDYLVEIVGRTKNDRNYAPGSYDVLQKDNVSLAWPLLQTAKFIKTKAGTFTAVINAEGKKNVYFKCKNDYLSLPNEQIIAEDIEKKAEYFSLLLENFGITSMDNLEYIKTNILEKYRDNILVETNDEHINDIKTILALIEKQRMGKYEITQLLKNFSLLQVNSKDPETTLYFPPNGCYFENADGVPIHEYFDEIKEVYYVVSAFYNENGITNDELYILGVNKSIIIGMDINAGDYNTGNLGKRPEWKNIGDFRYALNIVDINKALVFISKNQEKKLSKQKSKIIFSLFFKYEKHLYGKIKVGVKEHEQKETSELLRVLALGVLNGCYWNCGWNRKWLYSSSGELVNQSEISKYDLDESLYGKLQLDSSIYEKLGFAEGSGDETEKTLREYCNLSTRQRESYFEQELKRRYGISVEELTDTYGQAKSLGFNLPDATEIEDMSFEFPSRPVKDLSRLKTHVLEAVYCANPVKYEKVYQSMRISKNIESARSYLRSMYEVDGSYHKYACQICKTVQTSIEAVQIEKDPKLELDQLHICVCPNCASVFRTIRNDTEKMEDFWWAMDNTEIEDDTAIDIDFGDNSICFTQTHLAEIQAVRELILQK